MVKRTATFVSFWESKWERLPLGYATDFNFEFKMSEAHPTVSMKVLEGDCIIFGLKTVVSVGSNDCGIYIRC
jgi:hypothetical protein